MTSAIEQAVQIQGWRSQEEMDWIAGVASGAKVVIEVGVWKGRTTKVLAGSCDGVVYAVDHFQGADSNGDTTGRLAREQGSDALYAEFCENLADEIASGRVVPLRTNSAEAAERLRLFLGERCADLIFIDGEHSYEAVKSDILAYMSLLKPGGLICGDDYHPRWFGVMQAVDELLPGVCVIGVGVWSCRPCGSTVETRSP